MGLYTLKCWSLCPRNPEIAYLYSWRVEGVMIIYIAKNYILKVNNDFPELIVEELC